MVFVETESCSGLTIEDGNHGVILADDRMGNDDKEKRKKHGSMKDVAAIILSSCFLGEGKKSIYCVYPCPGGVQKKERVSGGQEEVS